MVLSCSLGISRFVPEKAKLFGVILYLPRLFGQGGWILALFFFAFLWTETKSRSIKFYGQITEKQLHHTISFDMKGLLLKKDQELLEIDKICIVHVSLISPLVAITHVL